MDDGIIATNDEPKFNPVTILDIKNSDARYKVFLTEYWNSNNDKFKAASKANISYSLLKEWEESAEFKEHSNILMEYKIDRLEARQFELGSAGDNRSAEFLLTNLAPKFKKKKPVSNDGNKVETLSDLVTMVNTNGKAAISNK